MNLHPRLNIMCCVETAPVSSSEVPELPTSVDACFSRRRVRFQQPLHEVVTELSRHKEQGNIWWQPSEREAAKHDILIDSQECLRRDSQSELDSVQHSTSFAEMYQAVFQVCHVLAIGDVNNTTTAEEDNDLSRMIGPEVISLLAVYRPRARGIEDRIVPHVALLRRLMRRESIRSIIKLHHQQQQQNVDTTYNSSHSVELWKQHQHETDERVRSLSVSLSRPSRTFACILGLADEAASRAFVRAACSQDNSDFCSSTSLKGKRSLVMLEQNVSVGKKRVRPRSQLVNTGAPPHEKSKCLEESAIA